jgi:predicted transcriptional regulator YdeE
MAEIARLYADIKSEPGMGMKVIGCHRETMPATRFIGIRYGDSDRNAEGGFGGQWRDWFENGRFAPLERLTLDTPEGRAYVGLMRCVPKFQYWIGVFCPKGTEVPEGYDHVDIPPMDIAVSWVQGKEENGEIYGARTHEESAAAARREHLVLRKEPWYFERYCEERFLKKNAAGEVILDYCIECEAPSAM